jgi:hypothetical protein
MFRYMNIDVCGCKNRSLATISLSLYSAYLQLQESTKLTVLFDVAMQTACSSETSVTIHQTWRNVPVTLLHMHRQQKLQACT